MDERKYTVGIDIGGTTTVIGMVADTGSIVDCVKIPTVGHASPETFVGCIAAEIEKLVNRLPAQSIVAGIGVGVPCANAETGLVEGAANLPWPNFPLVRLMEDAAGMPTFITNDANAAAIGEMTYGVAQGLDNFIMLTLGTGVGAGIVVDGHLLSGSRGYAGELGHMVFPFAADRMCACGRRGCLQTVSSAGGVVETARRLLDSEAIPSSLRDIDRDALSARDIGRAAEKNDALALEVFRFTGDAIGTACASFAAFSDPDAIILFGGVAGAARFMVDAMREALEREALYVYKGRIRILTSSLPEADAALLGAASLPLHYEKKNVKKDE